MWAAQPPLALGWLGWIAPVPWLWLVRQDALTGRRPYWTLWFAAFVFWMAALHWLRLPHPAVYLGWFALSAYLAIYLPLFVGLSRVARASIEDAAVARRARRLDRPRTRPGPRDDRLHDGLARPHASRTGRCVIQISDLVGEYGVDFVMILVAACDHLRRISHRAGQLAVAAGTRSFLPPRCFMAAAQLRDPTGRSRIRNRTNPSASPSSKATASPTGRPTPRSSSRS